ncbi:MAG: alpha/beta hydrolase [Prochloron sp. SP5CPC1]|nr:alpha/beta hydrolase [Candidatus Paraprochloron terpiosi SP5CPC1]
MVYDRATKKQSQTIEVRGWTHYYEWIRSGEQNNKKPVMVFLHGWGGSARYWRPIAEALSHGFDCLLYDLRGFGRSKLNNTKSKFSYELDEYAKDLAVLLDTLGLDVVYLNAHSMGASIATLFLNRYGERVTRAILTCSGIFTYDAKAFAAFHKFGGYVVKFRYNWFLKVPFADQLFMARFLNRSIDRDLRRAFLEDFLLADYDAALGTIYTSVNKQEVTRMPQEFSKLRVLTLLISGEKDKIIPAAMGLQAATLNDNIEYVEIAGTGHFPMLEDEENYLVRVRQFLAM